MKWSVMRLCWLGMFFGAERLPLSAAEDKPHTLFYLDDNRLIAFRLQITVDGKTTSCGGKSLDKRDVCVWGGFVFEVRRQSNARRFIRVSRARVRFARRANPRRTG